MTVTESFEQISPLFDVRQTTWGGRACFSKQSLKKGSVILEADDNTGTSISYEFRKEVCHFCYSYHNGVTLKHKITYALLKQLIKNNDNKLINWKKFQGAGLWFCSEICRDEFLSQPHIIELIECYELLLNHFHSMQKRVNPDDSREDELNHVKISKDLIQEKWDQIINDWIPSIDKLKLTKRSNRLPVISEDEYCCARFVCETLFRLKYMDQNSINFKSFYSLQSNEVSKMERFPILLHFQILVFKTLYILLPSFLRDRFSVTSFRHILGSEYGNAFGIWEVGESSDSREYFGYWIFPRASYFNHSCDPNLTKTRKGRTMFFTLNRDIDVGSELDIDYSGVLSLPVKERRKFLHDSWFFDCQCDRCKLEMQLIH
ncbi:hypothetical protein NCAS_0C01270 [Naumovozyma castellii]|uniref:SET domain-containing protein n=1 Tax=Naumovozyma castellii TaxID=27288 RepID=G0VCA8_NAUCA|nr:hypothetical protein NCAS_0C01270 [Naumovozyma castellii CBS 4309]CCC69117.1 hypothetical protein NCAS_0C01270 [Naumovozyma castellii CBS 4309]